MNSIMYWFTLSPAAQLVNMEGDSSSIDKLSTALYTEPVEPWRYIIVARVELNNPIIDGGNLLQPVDMPGGRGPSVWEPC